MQKFYMWLCGIFTVGAVVHLVRFALKLRIDINFHRIPLKLSLIIGVAALILAIIFYFLGKD